ncbi:MAG TPA: S8 family serine peptidase, partial [Thermoanaerobaculia bacterium]
MKRPVLTLFALLVATSLFAEETQRYIVVTKLPVRTEGISAALRELRVDVQPRAARAFESVNGFAADLTEREVAALAKSPNVAWVEPVLERHALGEVAANATSTQATPYGIDLIHAPQVWTGARGAAINVVVADTGIDFNHPELKAIYAGGINTFDATKTPFDDNSHGTHVSGTIAAADNDFGVVGIAPMVRLWAAKVLNASGSGTSEKLIQSI